MGTRFTLAAAALLAGVLLAGAEMPAGEEPTALARRFPEIARLVRHFDKRMASDSAAVRLKVLTELTYFHPRDSRLYPPFLRYLLKDASPKVRWEAIHRLRGHGIYLKRRELPESYLVPLAGLCEPGKAASLERLRGIVSANPHSPNAGWAAKALAVAKDENLLELLGPLTDSKNVFVRFCAAEAYLELGREKEGLKLMEGIAEMGKDPSGFYQMAAAEIMVRRGRAEYLGVLIQAMTRRAGYADSGVSILADLTGEYFPTAAEWKAWWAKDRAREPPPKPSQEPDPVPASSAGGHGSTVTSETARMPSQM